MCSDDILTLAAAIRVGAYYNFWCAKCFVTNLEESSDLKIPYFSDEENKSITNQSKDSPYRPNYCKFYQVKKLHLILVHFQDKSICVCSLLSPVSSLLLAELSLKESLVHKVTKEVLVKLGTLRRHFWGWGQGGWSLRRYKAVFRVFGLISRS